MACRLARQGPFDLAILEYELFAGNVLETLADGAILMTYPRLVIVADRATWGPAESAGILWKPLDPETLLSRILDLLAADAAPRSNPQR